MAKTRQSFGGRKNECREELSDSLLRRCSSDTYMEDNQEYKCQRQLLRRRSWASHVLKSVVVIFAFVGFYDTLFERLLYKEFGRCRSSTASDTTAMSSPISFSDPHQLERLSCSCGGGTVAEAKALGCVFDELASAWLPPHCIDRELSAEFRAFGWTYYPDSDADDGNRTLSLDEVAALADDYPRVPWFAGPEWHVQHCVFYWRKMWRAFHLGSVTIEAVYDNEQHILHCGEIFLERDPDTLVASGVMTDADRVIKVHYDNDNDGGGDDDVENE